MGLADRLREDDKDRKENRTSDEKLRDTFNETSNYLIKKFLAEAQSGAIAITDVADITRLFQIYLQVNQINDMASAGSGSLPALSSGQKDLIAQSLETTKVESNGVEEEVISLADIEAMDDEELDGLLKERELLMNQENEKAF